MQNTYYKSKRKSYLCTTNQQISTVMKILTASIFESYNICLGQKQETVLDTRLEPGTRYYINPGFYSDDDDTRAAENRAALSNYQFCDYITYVYEGDEAVIIGWVEFASVKEVAAGRYLHTVARYGQLTEPVALKEAPQHTVTETDDMPVGESITQKALLPHIAGDEIVMGRGKFFMEYEPRLFKECVSEIQFFVTKDFFNANFKKLKTITKVRLVTDTHEYLCTVRPIDNNYDDVCPGGPCAIDFVDTYELILPVLSSETTDRKTGELV